LKSVITLNELPLKETPSRKKTHLSGLERRIVLSDNTAAFRSKHVDILECEYAAGGKTTFSKHPHSDQIFYFLGGSGAITVGRRRFNVGPGSICFVPMNTFHAYENLGSEPLKFLMISAPPLSKKPKS
jgi:mannose-6-phosphate isomerase-like protein (cupin superfamily)